MRCDTVRRSAVQGSAVRDMVSEAKPIFFILASFGHKKTAKMRFFLVCLYLNYSSGEIKPAAIASAFTVAN